MKSKLNNQISGGVVTNAERDSEKLSFKNGRVTASQFSGRMEPEKGKRGAVSKIPRLLRPDFGAKFGFNGAAQD